VSGLDAQTAQRMCRVFSTRLRDFFASFDLLLTPTVPIPAFAAGALTPDAAAFPDWWDWTPLTWPFNLSRNPAASCPCGLTASGLPIGIQLVGRWFDESTILKASHAFLTARPFGRPVLDIGSP
jgi:aspartyl-tRNA(Asn)/glutamyl-tRNA(Gln) amidotransferase subunit A